MFFVLVLAVLYLGAGFAARCFWKYQVVSDFIESHSEESLPSRDIHDSRLQKMAWKWYHDLYGYFLLVCGPFGFLAPLLNLMNEAMDGKRGIHFLL